MIALKSVQGRFALEAAQNMLTPEGKTDLSDGGVTALAGYMACIVLGGPWATMDEWGKGSLLDFDNPALADYITSEYWNPLRGNRPGGLDTAIVGRLAGPYKNIFGKTKVSSGKLAGRNLEKMAEEGKLRNPEDYLPKPPSHAMQRAARELMNGPFQKEILTAVAKMPWGMFFVCTED